MNGLAITEHELSIPANTDHPQLAATLRLPAAESGSPPQRRPAIIVLHGFGSTRQAPNVTVPATLYAQWGYVALSFDMPGCGQSGGAPGHVLCLDQVAATRAAIDWLSQREDVDASRIAVSGTSFGAAVALYTTGVDARIKAVVAAGGWGNGARKLRGQHPGPGAWEKFLALLEQGKAMKARGETLKVHRFDIVPIPPHLRIGLPENALMEFPIDTAQSIYDFRPDDVIAAIAPRPVLFLHASVDSVTPTSESIAMFQIARPPAELHLFTGVDHFMLGERNARVQDTLAGWLRMHFPV